MSALTTRHSHVIINPLVAHLYHHMYCSSFLLFSMHSFFYLKPLLLASKGNIHFLVTTNKVVLIATHVIAILNTAAAVAHDHSKLDLIRYLCCVSLSTSLYFNELLNTAIPISTMQRLAEHDVITMLTYCDYVAILRFSRVIHLNAPFLS